MEKKPVQNRNQDKLSYGIRKVFLGFTDIEAPRSELRGIFHLTRTFSILARSLTPQPRRTGFPLRYNKLAGKKGTAPKGWDSKRSAGNALAVSVQQVRKVCIK